MTLNELAVEHTKLMGIGLGFVIKSLETGNKFTVAHKFVSGKFGISRLDTGKDYIVEGDSDRYDFVVGLGTIKEAKVELAELAEQKATIEARMGTLTGVLNGIVGMVG